MKKIIIFILSIFPLILYSQSSKEDIKRNLIKDFQFLRQSDGIIKINDYHFDSLNLVYFLNFFDNYDKDSSVNIHYAIQVLRLQISRQISDTLIRQKIVESFLKDFSSVDERILSVALKSLLLFKTSDFSGYAKEKIIQNFNNLKENNEFLLVCGNAMVRELLPKIKQIASLFDRSKSKWYNSNTWYAMIVCSKLGYQGKIDTMISAVELEIDPSIRVIHLLHDLAYTQHPDCFKLLIKYLNSNESFPKLGDDVLDFDYNQYALDYLVRYMPNFPIKYTLLEKGGYSKNDIELGRHYLKIKYSY